MSPSLESILGAGTLAAFETPGPAAAGLPAAAYTSDAFFARENERIFSGSWVFAGLAHELARPGDAAPATVAGRPVLLVRDGACRVRAFQTPCFGGRDARAAAAGFGRGQHDLVPVRSATWHDWIFVDLSGSAPPIEDFVAPLRKRLDGLELAELRHLVTLDLGEVCANWKLTMENFIEPCPVRFGHATTAERPLAVNDTGNDDTGNDDTGNDPGCPGCAVDGSGGAKRTDTQSADSRYLTLFPNFVLGLYLPDRVGVHLNVPLAPDRTLQRQAIYSLGPDPALAERKEPLAALWREVHLEDRIVSEWLQQERGSGAAAAGGALPPVWRDSVRSFQELVVRSLR